MSTSHHHSNFTMPKLLVAYALLGALVVSGTSTPDSHILSDEDIHYINHVANTTWMAGHNFHPDDHAHVKRLMGSRMDRPGDDVLPVKLFTHKIRRQDLPRSFDARTRWPNCPSLREIRDQGNCGSCWAMAAVECMTDRICIASGGKKQFYFSTEDVLTCCSECCNGCIAGYPRRAWIYFMDEGIVSGGRYNSSQGCQPYEIQPCEHNVPGKLRQCSKKLSPTPKCKKTCEAGYNKTYSQDKHYGAKAYVILGETNIMQELVTNGPVEASFNAHTDFIYYKTGVYQYTRGKPLGGHAVKILGYGVEKGIKYWLAANSWNSAWGDKGFFKILRGRDECGIENDVVAGEPRL